MSAIIEKVETFIQRLQDLEYIVTPEATRIWYTTRTTAYPTPQDRINLSDSLAKAMVQYQKHKDDEKERLNYAQICLIWINRAFTSGVIREGEGLAKKLVECKERNKMLEKDLEELSTQYIQLQQRYEPFMTHFTPIHEDRNQEDEQ